MSAAWNGMPPVPFNDRPYLDHVLQRKSDKGIVRARWFPHGASAFWGFANAHTMGVTEAIRRCNYVTPIMTPGLVCQIINECIISSKDEVRKLLEPFANEAECYSPGQNDGYVFNPQERADHIDHIKIGDLFAAQTEFNKRGKL